MNDNEFWVKVWTRISIIVIAIIFVTGACNIVDRVGPQRPIVTQTIQYQAK